MNPRQLENLTYVEVQQYLARNDVIVLPLGVVEPHGRHLPLGTDGFCALAAAEAIAERLDALIAPVLHYGPIGSLASYPGYTTLSRETYMAVLRETVSSLVASGFKVFIFSNGHGPNHGPACDVAREFIGQPGLFFVIAEWYDLSKALAEEIYADKGGHAGIQETSLMLHARPELVKEALYDEQHLHVFQAGLTTFPRPAAVLLAREEDRPVFDREKANQYSTRALAITATEIEKVVRQWRETFAAVK